MINLVFASLFGVASFAHSQQPDEVSTSAKAPTELKLTVSTTWLTFSNVGNPETNTHHYELRLGYQLTPKDHLGIKLTTWKLFAPMGIDLWNPALLDRAYFYPGRVRERGLGLTYQRRLYKGLFVALEVLPLFTAYLDEKGDQVGRGLKIYNSYHLGYHIPIFLKGRLFIEPQLHANHWPINTNVAPAFQQEEDRWDKVFLVEPNLYFGFKL